jgi:hypothetical protein
MNGDRFVKQFADDSTPVRRADAADEPVTARVHRDEKQLFALVSEVVGQRREISACSFYLGASLQG